VSMGSNCSLPNFGALSRCGRGSGTALCFEFLRACARKYAQSFLIFPSPSLRTRYAMRYASSRSSLLHLTDPILAPIYHNCLPGDERSIIARQEQDCAYDILWLSRALDRLPSKRAAFLLVGLRRGCQCVFITPGNTEFAVMPSFATSFARPLMNPMMPMFVAV
jgi:hypothetical protein